MTNRSLVACFMIFLLSTLSACGAGIPVEEIDLDGAVKSTTSSEEEVSQVEVPESIVSIAPDELPSSLLHPDDLVYQGAFRLPEGSNGSNWEYSGYAMTYYPEGDPNGPDDGFPGSIFALGHDHQQYVSEISIPAPVISPTKNPDDLNTAITLQMFNDIRSGLFGELEIPRAGLEYLPPQGSQTSGKLYFSWGQHFQFEQEPSHGWSELDLSSPQPAGPWHISDFTNYVTNDYIFEIPEEWAAVYTPGLRLASGRFRDGEWGGLGPAIIAIGPWTEGDPPTPGTVLGNVVPLLLYGVPESGNPEISVSDEMKMITYQEPDEWSGGAWLTAGEKSSVILIGTKAEGKTWYGFANGVVYPISGDPDEEVPEVPPWPFDDRGWWSEDISAQIIFFNPADMADVAGGGMETWEPQPYTSLDIDEYLFDPGFDYENQKRTLVGAASFDRAHGNLYFFERRADEEKSLIHIFKIEG